MHNVWLERDSKKVIHGGTRAKDFSRVGDSLDFMIVSRRFYFTSVLPRLDSVPVTVNGSPRSGDSGRGYHRYLDKK